MQTFLTILEIVFFFWPLILVLGLFGKRDAEASMGNKIMLSLQRIFLAWCLMLGVALVLITQDHPLSGILPEPTNWVLFSVLGVILGLPVLINIITRMRQRRADQLEAGTLEALRNLSPDEFENVIAQFFERIGYRARVSEDVQDHGVDVFVYDGKGEKWVVQCKRYRGVVGEPILRDLLGVMLHEKATRAFLMTTGTISQKARDWIEDKPITVYESEGLVRVLQFNTVDTQ
ncbi:MAG: restriction endonuclease [Anaerolineaceae bacterium]|nr:restriction endonuclease [Anaerolineaceae bacterium]